MLTSVKILFIQIFQEGWKTINDPNAAVRNCYRSISHKSPRSDVSVLDSSILSTETLLRSTKTKRLMVCLLQTEITKLAAKWLSPHVSKHMARQDGERNICGTIDGRSGHFNSLQGRSVPCFGRNGAFTHPSPLSQDPK